MEWTPGSYLRIIPELRTSTLREVQSQIGVKVLYYKEKYDLQIAPEKSKFRKVNTIQAMYEVFKSDAVVLELTEPLWMRELIRTILIGFTWKGRSFIRRKSNYCFTYAIENNDLNTLVYGTVYSHNFLIRYIRKYIRFFISRIYTHAAFGTYAAYKNYADNEFLVQIPHIYPSRYSILESSTTGSLNSEFGDLPTLRKGNQAKLTYLFVGVLEKRKGIDLLIQAWEILDGVGFKGRLLIVGSGALESKVSQWCLEAPERRAYLGFKTGESLDSIYETSDVLLAPSQREGRWREQVGLPILEGLSFGLTVITTSETGIADGLRENGHIVLDDGNNPISLAKGISVAPNTLMSKDYVKAQVKGISNREKAFDWARSSYSLKSEKNS
jgi:glycosyltransferase involved in cell wall biosynthesis